MFRVFSPISKALRAFFVSDLRVRRGDGGLQVVLEDQPKDAQQKRRKKSKPDLAAEKEARDFAMILASLTALLDHMPENRTVLRHLVFIEHALRKKGMRALHKVPYDVLQHALQQFEGVVVNWSDEGLACLRSKMAVTLIDRENNGGDDEAAATSSVVDSIHTAPLPEPVTLEGDDADEAEAALLAAYGALPGLDSRAVPLDPISAMGSGKGAVADDNEPRESQFEVQGELSSPSAKALAKSAKAIALREKVDLRLRELQQ